MVPLSDVVFAFDMNRIEVMNGVRHLWDYGPNGFHFAFPGGAADPTPQLDGSLLFAGAQYLALPAGRLAAFYAAMPTREHTWLAAVSSGGGGGVYSSWDGTTLGQNILIVGSTVRVYQGQAAAFPDARLPAGSFADVGRKRVFALTIETTPRLLLDQSTGTATWNGGAFGVGAYNTATVPRIGMYPSGLTPLTGRLWYLAQIRGAVSSADLMLLSRLVSEGTKPFCVRA